MDALKEHQQRASAAFEAVTKDAQSVIVELADQEELATFVSEYKGLFGVLKKAHENEKRLIKKSRELQSEIMVFEGKVADTASFVDNSEDAIRSLNTDAANLQEKITKATAKTESRTALCEKLRAEIEEINNSDQSGVTQDDQNLLQSLTLQQELNAKEVERFFEDVDHVENLKESTRKEYQKLLKKQEKADAELAVGRGKIDAKKAEIERRTAELEDVQNRIAENRAIADENAADLRAKQQTLHAETLLKEKIEASVKEFTAKEAQLETDCKKIIEDKRLTDMKLVEAIKECEKLVKDCTDREAIRNLKQQEYRHLRREIDKKIVVQIEETQIKVDETNQMRKEAEEERAEAKQKVQTAQAEADQAAKYLEQAQKDVDSSLRERDILNRTVIKADEAVKKSIELVQHKEGEVVQLRKEINQWKVEAQEYRKKIFNTEKEREKVGVDLSAANAKYYAAQEELKLRAARIEEVQKQISDVKAKLAQQKNLY